MRGEEAVGYIDSALFREKFLRRAQAEGIVFSRDGAGLTRRDSGYEAAWNGWHRRIGLAVAASLLVALGGVGGYHLRYSEKSAMPRVSEVPDAIALQSAASNIADQNREASISRLESENHRLTAEIASLRSTLARDTSMLGQL